MKLQVNLLQMDTTNKKVTMSTEEFKKIMKLAKIGSAAEKAFADGYIFCFKRPDRTILECMKNTEELLEEN